MSETRSRTSEAPPGQAPRGVSRRRFLAGAAATATAAALPVLGVPGLAGAAPAAPAASPATRPKAGRVLPRPQAVIAKGGDLADLEMVEVASLLQAGAISSRELTDAAFARIDARDGDLTAWRNLYPELAYEMADRADRALSRMRRGVSSTTTLMTGIPVGIKDIIAIKGLPLTFGSDAFADHIAPGDAPAWLRLKDAGVVLLGHTRTLEFASGASPQTASNPWDFTKSPGGSSNGSGAAVGGRQVWMALGTDSGGSLRRPATVCGVATMKATYGRVSTWGILTTNRNGDHVGPLARSVADCAFTLSYLAGADPNDPVTLAAPPPPDMYPTLAFAKGGKPFSGMVFGVTTSEPTVGELDNGVRAVYERFLARMASLGATLREVASPARVGLGSGGPSPEALQFQLRWFAEKGDLYQAPARQSAINTLANQDNGTIKSYYQSLVARAAYIEAWKKVFSDNSLNALLTPAITVETPGRDKPLAEFGPNIRGYWNTLGFPVLGIPAGFSPDTGMPVGVQIAGAPFTESELFSIGLEYEARYDEHTAIPTPYR